MNTITIKASAFQLREAFIYPHMLPAQCVVTCPACVGLGTIEHTLRKCPACDGVGKLKARIEQ